MEPLLYVQLPRISVRKLLYPSREQKIDFLIIVDEMSRRIDNIEAAIQAETRQPEPEDAKPS